MRFRLTLPKPLFNSANLLGLRLNAATGAFRLNTIFRKKFALLRQLLFQFVELLLQRALFLFFHLNIGNQFRKCSSGGLQTRRRFAGFTIQGFELASQQTAKVGNHFGLQFFPTLGFCSLTLQRIHLAAHFFQNVEHARKIRFGPFQLCFSQTALGFEASDSGRFFNHRAAIVRTAAKNLANTALFNNCVRFRSQAGTHKDVLNVPQTCGFAVHQIFAFARPEQSAGDNDIALLVRLIGWDVAGGSCCHKVCPGCKFQHFNLLGDRLNPRVG